VRPLECGRTVIQDPSITSPARTSIQAQHMSTCRSELLLALLASIEARWRQFSDSRVFALSSARLRALDRQLDGTNSALTTLLAPAAKDQVAPL
jgi:hypothetical protein